MASTKKEISGYAPVSKDNVVAVTAVPETTEISPIVECVAPATLPGGYELHVDNNGRSLVVLIPKEGVQEGQRFTASVLRDETLQHREIHQIPVGHWRDGLCDCCNPWCFHFACCLSFFCRPIALGQVMTRMGLDWMGVPRSRIERHSRVSPFKVLLVTFVVFFSFELFCVMLYVPYQGVAFDVNGNLVAKIDTAPGFVLFLFALHKMVRVAYFFFMLILMIRTRSYIRSKYAIPEGSCCRGCDDVCCSFFCTPCTVAQMSRHTADYDTYPAECCSETGLCADAPEVV